MFRNKGWLVALIIGLVASSVQAGEKIIKPWVTGYFPGDRQVETDGSMGIMTDNEWNTLTHMIHFTVELKQDGSLNFDSGSPGKMSPAKRAAAITLAHQKSVPLLLCLNGWIDNYVPILSDVTKRKTAINALITTLKEGYDGFDIDLEPITPYGSATNAAYESFINDLYAQMKTVTKTNNPKMIVDRPLLTVAAGYDAREAPLLLRLIDKIDQINIMAYDMSSIYQCTVWFDSPVYDAGNKYLSTGAPVVSVDNAIKAYKTAGVPLSKLGLGMSFESRIWQGGKFSASTNGALSPMQSWATDACDTSPNRPLNWNDGTTPREDYAATMKYRYKPEYYRWDKNAKASYLTIDQTGSANDMFISLSDARSVRERVNYAKTNGLGGLAIWHMGGECIHTLDPSGTGSLTQCVPGQAGKNRPLMTAMRKALHTGTGK